MSFKRDFYVCECGHLRRDHSDNYPRTKCLANPECKCEKFSRLTKRAPDLGVRAAKIVLSTDGNPAIGDESKPAPSG